MGTPVRMVLGLIAATAAVAAATPAEAAAPEVSWTTELSGTAAELPAECGDRSSPSHAQLAVDPADPERLSAIYLENGITAAVSATSADGGATWQREAVDGATACTGGPAVRAISVNPTLALAPDGTPLFGNSWAGGGGRLEPTLEGQELWQYGVLAHRGAEQGVAPEAGYGQDVSFAAGPGDTVYALWNRFEQVPNHVTYAPLAQQLRFAVSADGGRSFGPARTVALAPAGLVLDTARIVVNPDGSLLALTGLTPLVNQAKLLAGEPVEFEILASRSTDGGASWSLPATAGRTSLVQARDPEGNCGPGSFACSVVTLNLEVAAGADGSVVIASATPRRSGSASVQLIRSPDGGASWEPPLDAVTVAGNVAQPALAVQPDGTMGMFWYDDRSDVPADAGWSWDARFATSADGGATWREVHLDGPFDLRPAPDYDADGEETGVYQDVVALPDGFGVAYTVAQPVAGEGMTDVRFARIRAGE